MTALTFLVGFYAEARAREQQLGLTQQLLLTGMNPAPFYIATFVFDFLLVRAFNITSSIHPLYMT
jgi:hypothetical protein